MLFCNIQALKTRNRGRDASLYAWDNTKTIADKGSNACPGHYVRKWIRVQHEVRDNRLAVSIDKTLFLHLRRIRFQNEGKEVAADNPKVVIWAVGPWWSSIFTTFINSSLPPLFAVLRRTKLWCQILSVPSSCQERQVCSIFIKLPVSYIKLRSTLIPRAKRKRIKILIKPLLTSAVLLHAAEDQYWLQCMLQEIKENHFKYERWVSLWWKCKFLWIKPEFSITYLPFSCWRNRVTFDWEEGVQRMCVWGI